MTAISTAPPSVLPLHLRTLAVDIGGTGIKALVLDDQGSPISSRERLPTPRPATPPAVLEVIAELASGQPDYDRVAVGFPGVVMQGVTLTAPNLHPDWHGFPLERELSARLGRPVRVANDADVQGFGAIGGEGLEMVLTLGTGLGSALFIDGILVPNLELAHHPFAENRTYEQWLGQKALDELGDERWKATLHEAIDLIRRIFNFNVLYLGGGNAQTRRGRNARRCPAGAEHRRPAGWHRPLDRNARDVAGPGAALHRGLLRDRQIVVRCCQYRHRRLNLPRPSPTS